MYHRVSPGTGPLTHFISVIRGAFSTSTRTDELHLHKKETQKKYNNHASLASLRLASICMRLPRAIRALPALALAKKRRSKARNATDILYSSVSTFCVDGVCTYTSLSKMPPLRCTYNVSRNLSPLTHEKFLCGLFKNKNNTTNR